MKVALFLTDEKIESHDMETIPVMILSVNNEVINDVEKDIIVKKDINYLSLWMLTKKIEEIYVMDIDSLIKKLFENLGVKVRIFEDVKGKHYLKSFLSSIFI